MCWIPGIRSAQPEEDPALEIASKSVELLDRTGLESGSAAARSKSPERAALWVLSSDPSPAKAAGDENPAAETSAQGNVEPGAGGAVSRSAGATPTQTRDGTEPHMLRDFYNLQVTIDMGSNVVSPGEWLFDVKISEVRNKPPRDQLDPPCWRVCSCVLNTCLQLLKVGGEGRGSWAGQNLKVDAGNKIIFYDDPKPGKLDPTVVCPVDVLPWIAQPEQLYETSLHIEVWSSRPERAKVSQDCHERPRTAGSNSGHCYM